MILVLLDNFVLEYVLLIENELYLVVFFNYLGFLKCMMFKNLENYFLIFCEDGLVIWVVMKYFFN